MGVEASWARAPGPEQWCRQSVLLGCPLPGRKRQVIQDPFIEYLQGPGYRYGLYISMMMVDTMLSVLYTRHCIIKDLQYTTRCIIIISNNAGCVLHGRLPINSHI